MAGWRDLGNIWNTFREIDIRPLREDAERSILLAVVGAADVGKTTLIGALRHDARAREKVISPTIEAGLDPGDRVSAADLIILMLDASQREHPVESDLYREWKKVGRRVVVFYNKVDTVRDSRILGTASAPWSDARVAMGSALSPDSMTTDLVPRVIDEIPDHRLALARRFPLFRMTIARELINDTSAANAAYALGTGLAEVVPALDIPFNVADIVVLTKNQAIMVYKLGLALGLSTRWQDHVAELGGVVGAGFLWRQVARQLVGLIPVWGIVPQVAVAYAGTFAVGEAVLYWYHTGRKISGQEMRAVYADALARGRQVAQGLLTRAPRPELPRMALPALPRRRAKNTCLTCGRVNPRDAKFCAYCAAPLS